MTHVPLEQSYWVKEPVLLAGVYAGAPERGETRDKLRSLLRAGVRSICNLTEATEGLRDYETDFAEIAGEMGVDARMERFGIPDVSTTSPEHMMRILDWIDEQLLESRPVYVHCWGGIGRTGMVVGCWLVRHGKVTGETVLDHIKQLRRNTSDIWKRSPETPEQRALVREWAHHETRLRDAGRRGLTEKASDLGVLSPGAVKRAQGCLLGQLAGDALGSLVEFQSPESISVAYPSGVRELKDGGTWNTIAGQPTDDSEMALALARSILRAGRYDVREAARAYDDWLNSLPFDVGNTIGSALRGHKNPESQANGALMRVSPLGIHAARFTRSDAAEWAGADAALTHPNPVCLQANELYTMAIAEAVATGPNTASLWHLIEEWARERSVEPTLAAAIQSSRTAKPADFVHQAGWVLIAFQNALYQLLHNTSLEEAIVDTVMQGGDTDTNAAICGALLGAVHGIDAIPEQWRRTMLACRPDAAIPGVVHPRPKEYWPADALELAADLVGVQDEKAFDPSTVNLSKVTRQGIARLVGFLPGLTPEENTETQFGLPPGAHQTGANSFEIDPSTLSDVPTEFIQACYDEGFVQPFDWMSWHSTQPAELRPDASFDDAELSTIIKLLTLHIRADRFGDGHFLVALRNGTISKILRQLAELGEQMDTVGSE